MASPEYHCGGSAPKPLEMRTEQEVMGSWQTEGLPLVSVVCATYNHVEYLEDALKGFLGQVTSFPFEIIVRDDASTDGTTELLLAYASRYPNIIRAVIEKENQYSKGVRANPALVQFARGEYIAICEGDDYWIAPDKLEKQVALLRAHPDATMSVAGALMCKMVDGKLFCETQFAGSDNQQLFFDDVKSVYFHTSTYVIRSDAYRAVLARYLGKIEFGDTALRYMLADLGPLVSLKDIVSVYRVTGNGIWTSLSRVNQVVWELRMAEGFYRHFNPRHRRYFARVLFGYYKWLFAHDLWSFNRRSAVANMANFLTLFISLGVDYLRGFRFVKRQRK